MARLARLFTSLGLYVGLLAAGCASQAKVGQWQGPAEAAPSRQQKWDFNDTKAKVLQSEHYRVYTTIEDPEVVDLLPQVMEGAMSVYRQVAPGVKVSDQPMECFIFRWRSEWDQWTMRYTGSDSKIYRQIRSGGYTIRDQYVAYYIGRSGTFSVAGHEGWHQFAGRHFKGRLPPFLEEGMACMFETVTWENNLPRWNLSVNAMRAQTLRKALDSREVWSLRDLCSMHAGDIVGESNERIDTFYAQCWAFARFLWDAENGKYRPAMQRWLSETAAGTVFDPTRSHTRSFNPWNRRAVAPMIEHYLDGDLETIEKAYQAFMRKAAYDELSPQWRS